jgi:citrate synthase
MQSSNAPVTAASKKQKNGTLTVTDNRTGSQYELPIESGTVRSTDFRKIKSEPDDFGMIMFDPAYMNTASCRSSITFIDGDKGILRYRGYPIEQLAEWCTFLEVAYLLVHGELPDKDQLADWTRGIAEHIQVHENLKKFMDSFRHDAHPMPMLMGAVASLSCFYPSAKEIFDPPERQMNMYRLLGKTPTLVAYAYRHSVGKPYVDPEVGLGYVENFMQMAFKRPGQKYQPDPVLVRALDILLVLQADHEQNCSTSALRTVASSQVDPYCSVAAAIGALFGPLHGGANEAVLLMLDEIDSIVKVPAFIKEVKEGKRKLMGFGHRIYKNFDPRAAIIKKMADQVFSVTGSNPKLAIAMELERIALQDDYFVSRRLYPNVDFYSGLLYQALNFPAAFFPVLFAMSRMSGWLAQWEELVQDSEQKIARPRQIYTGHELRNVPDAFRYR